MMRIIQLIYCLCYLGGIFFSGYIVAQERYSSWKARIDSIVNPTLLENGGQILQFDSLVRHIGRLSETEIPRSVRFPFTNVSHSVVHIANVKTSCGCMSAASDKKILAPYEKGIITLTYHPNDRVGTVDAQAFVYTNVSGKRPVARLTLLGEVVSDDKWGHLPKAMGSLRLKRKIVTFNQLTPKQCPSERIPCANSGDISLKLSAKLLPLYITFRTEPEVLSPGEEGELVITVDGSRLPENRMSPFKFSLMVEGVRGRPSERMIQIIIN